MESKMDEEAKELLGLIEHHLETISCALIVLVLEKGGGQDTEWFSNLMSKLADNTDGFWKQATEEKEKS